MAKRRSGTTNKAPRRRFDARPDGIDFRDQMFQPTLVEVPPRIPLEDYLKCDPPLLDQGIEGACTGFGLAAVCHYLLRNRRIEPDNTPVSARMLYEMARRYDEWPGEEYEGSSARGAMKGWHKHGVCSEALWPHVAGQRDMRLGTRRSRNAAQRPLGAYFRVNHKDLVAMHAALAEVGILFATALVHSGWNRVDGDGNIPRHRRMLGGHAFAIVAYDEDGFWIQNSWGPAWGKGGFARITYSDWLDNGMDAWVARLGAPIRMFDSDIVPGRGTGIATTSLAFEDIRPHLISIGNEGTLRKSGTFGNDRRVVEDIFRGHFPRITRNWRRKRLLLYAHGGLVPEKNAIQRVENYLEALRGSQVYPVAFIWNTDFWSTIRNILEDALRRRRSEGLLGDAKDFMLDRVDDALEPLARVLSGKLQWGEMKENALRASTREDGGARLVAAEIAALAAREPGLEIHIAGHSAGSIFCAPLIQLLCSDGKIEAGPMRGEQGHGLNVGHCSLWAPACTVSLFKQTYLPAIDSRRLSTFALFNLNDDTERDDHCARIYNKSLLYLVSNAFEERQRIPVMREHGEPLLGLDKFVTRDRGLQKLLRHRFAEYVLAPNTNAIGHKDASHARKHGDFDDDVATVKATLARITGVKEFRRALHFPRSKSSTRDRRRTLARKL